MTSTTGSTAPLHRKFDEKNSLRQIRHRYRALQDEIADQVEALQQDERFLHRCEEFYNKGYKDWHILCAIYNLMIHTRLRELGNTLRTKGEREASKQVPKQLRGVVYPVEEFLASEMDFMFINHALTCLKQYGFEDRGVPLASEPVMKFLRERMRHFDLDIPHAPMFARPPNTWPKR
jgi:hypothetical protein